MKRQRNKPCKRNKSCGTKQCIPSLPFIHAWHPAREKSHLQSRPPKRNKHYTFILVLIMTASIHSVQ
jgi:hypothetical protein